MSDGAATLTKAVARLDALVDQGRRNPRALTRDDLRELPVVYRRVSAALAEARAHNLSLDQLARVERVLISAHGMLYAPEPPRPLRGLMELIREIPDVFWRARRSIALAFLLCVLGGVWGYRTVRREAANAVALLPPEAIENARAFKDPFKRDGDPIYGVFYFTHNSTVAFAAYALGTTFGIGTFISMLYNGVAFGGTIAIALSSGGSARLFSYVVGHGGIELLATFMAGGAGFEMAYAMLRPGWKKRSEALRDAARATLPLPLGASMLLSVAGLVEGWISPKSLPFAAKASLGATLLGLALLYLFFGRTLGRRRTVSS